MFMHGIVQSSLKQRRLGLGTPEMEAEGSRLRGFRKMLWRVLYERGHGRDGFDRAGSYVPVFQACHVSPLTRLEPGLRGIYLT
jgi:hypothetical protein